MGVSHVVQSPLFPPGTRVRAYPRVHDRFSPALDPVASAQVGKDGSAELKGLDANRPYWVAGEVVVGEGREWRSVAVTPKSKEFLNLSPEERSGRVATNVQMQAEREGRAAQHSSQLASAAPGRSTGRRVVEGARGSKVRRDPEAVPYPNQRDVNKVPQRSDTEFGEAHPKEVSEHVPRVPVDAVASKTPQRSSTEFGEATPKDKGEELPHLDQDDVGKVRQRSDTPEGEATPKPKRSAKDEMIEREGSAAKAAGGTPAQPRESTTKKVKDPPVKKAKKDER